MSGWLDFFLMLVFKEMRLDINIVKELVRGSLSPKRGSKKCLSLRPIFSI